MSTPLRSLARCVVAAALAGCAEGGVFGGNVDDVGAEATPLDDVAPERAADDTTIDAPLSDAGDHDGASPEVNDDAPTSDRGPPLDLAPIDVSIDQSVTVDLAPSDRGATIDLAPIDRGATIDLTPVDRSAPDVVVDTAPLDRGAPDVRVDVPIVDVPAPMDRCLLTPCGAECVDTSASVRHCGACGRNCPALPRVTSVACVSGTCTFAPGSCEAGWADCDSVPTNGCEADLTRATNCGACGVRCSAPPGGVAACVGGSCMLSCGPGTHLCGAACASDASPATCGAACSPCPTPSDARATCTGGRCGVVCNAGFALQPDGTCRRTFCGMASIACGGGGACPANSACVAGGCVCNLGFQATTCAGVPCTSCTTEFFCAPVFCGGGFVTCRDGGGCPANSICSPDSRFCACATGFRAVTCAGVPCTSCVYPGWRCAR